MTTVEVNPRQSAFERVKAVIIRGFLRGAFRGVMSPRRTPAFQRRWIKLLSRFTPARRGVVREQRLVAQVPVEITSVPSAKKTSAAMLYIHGGGFCLCSPATHHSVTSILALESGMSVWTPDYRLAPENPYPAGLEDVLATYHEMLRAGYSAEQVVIAGDSAGGALALALAIRLRTTNQPRPAALLLLSPLTDLQQSADTQRTVAAHDPMIRGDWLDQMLMWYACPPGTPEHCPLEIDLQGLPPLLIQVGDLEFLLADSTRLAEHAARCQVECRLEIYHGRWHVFQLQSRFLPSSVTALQALAAFARDKTQTTG